VQLDTLIAEVGAEAVARFRRPLFDRAEAERLLSELLAAQSPVAMAHAATGTEPETPTAPADPPRRAIERPTELDDSADRSGRVRELRAATRRATGGHRPVRRRPVKDRGTADHADPFLDQEHRPGQPEGRRPVPHSALLRPPSRPLPRVSMSSAPPEPEPAPSGSPTRAAMSALFDDDDNSTDGLVFLGDPPESTSGLAPQPGTDPAIAPLPAGGSDDATGESSADIERIERTTDELEVPAHPADPSDVPQLAGAEAPTPMDVPAAPFGFGPGDAEPTRVDRRVAVSSPPDRHAPAHLSEEVVVSSVRKLFRR